MNQLKPESNDDQNMNSDWRADLDNFFSRQTQLEEAERHQLAARRMEVEEFLAQTVLPAFEQLKSHLEEHGREVEIASGRGQAIITVMYQDNPEIMYRLYAITPQPFIEYAYISRETGKAVKSSDRISTEAGPLSIADIDQEVIIRHFIRKYKSVAA